MRNEELESLTQEPERKEIYIYTAVENNDMEWKKSVPENVARIISENWDIITKFASGEDMTTRVAGMKFPKEGYNSK